MNTDEFLKRMTEAIKTDTKSSSAEAIKQAMVTMVFIEIPKDFFFWAVEKHRDVVDEFLEEKFKEQR